MPDFYTVMIYGYITGSVSKRIIVGRNALNFYGCCYSSIRASTIQVSFKVSLELFAVFELLNIKGIITIKNEEQNLYDNNVYSLCLQAS